MEVSNDREIVSAMHRALAGRVGQERFAVWFGRGVRMETRGKTLRIAAADTFRLDYLRRAFRADLIEAARLASSNLIDVEFVVDSAASAVAAPQEHQPLESSRTQEAPAMERQQDNSVPASNAKLAAPTEANDDAQHRQPRRQFASLGDFLASEPNRVALSAARTAAARPGVYTPLTFVGPPGCGKTHLLEGIWRHARTAHTLSRVIYLSAEQFTNQFVESLRGGGAPSFRRKIRDVEMLLIDDVQFFGNKQSTLVELVHTIDTLLRSNRQLVFAADRPPDELRPLGQELITRLSGGLVCTLEPADCSTRLAILRQLAQRQAISIPDEVLQWMAAQLSGDARHLTGAINRLRAVNEVHQAAINLEFAQTALADLVQSSRRPVRLPDIVGAVCDVLGVPAEQLQSSSKAASATIPRMLVMFLGRKWTRAGLTEISRTVGRKSHSTVLSAQQRVTQMMADGKTIPLGFGNCRIEDAVKRIEAHLRLA